MSERFIIKEQISTRASADAFLAHDTKTDQLVRLRRIHSQMTPEELNSVSDAFRVTQRQLALAKSDLISQITESGIDDEGAWLTLEYYESEHLLNVYTAPIALAEFHNVATQLLAALKAIHDENLVHGALSMNSVDVVAPETPEGRVVYYLRDLGMRKLMVLVHNPHAISSLPGDVALLAPELFHSQDAQPTSDLYMLGNLLYTLLTYGHPFAGFNNEDALANHLAHNIPLAHTINPDIPEEVSTWIDKLTQPDPKSRYQSADEAIAALPFIGLDTRRQPTALIYDKGKLTTAHAVQVKKLAESRKLPNRLYVISAIVLVASVALYLMLRSDSSEPSDLATTPTEEIHTVEIKPVATGTISGSNLAITNTSFRIGTNDQETLTWGTDKSKNAKGPDLGASYRAFVIFKVADIIDADSGDKLVNVASLDKLQLELRIDRENTAPFLPLLYLPMTVKDANHNNIRNLSQSLEGGVMPREKNNTLIYSLENVGLSVTSYYEYIAFIITANKKPGKGEILNFDSSSLILKISK